MKLLNKKNKKTRNKCDSIQRNDQLQYKYLLSPSLKSLFQFIKNVNCRISASRMDKGVSTNIGQNDKGHLASKVSHYGSSNSLDFSQCGLKMDPWSSEGFWWNEKSIHRRSFPGLPYFNEVLINCVLMMHRPIAFQSRKIEHCSDKQYSYWKSTKLNSRGPEGT